jgi:DNA-binding response OmpR family regulator
MDQQTSSEQNKVLPIAQVIENQNVHLVVVEDDKFLRDLIVRKLTKEGFIVVAAEDGEIGIDAIRKELPQVVLLDILLPGISGFDVLEQIKKDEKLKDIPVIMLSNLGQKEEVDRALLLGAKDFLIKAKYTPGEIVTHIKDILKESYL